MVDIVANRLPHGINWQLTYACQLRCEHCYTESGRRAARTLARADLLQIAAILVKMQVRSVQLGGGEPLLVPSLLEIAKCLKDGGVHTNLYTNGVDITDATAFELAQNFPQINVSIDGATAAVHDAIRGRAGAFDTSMRTLSAFDRAASQLRETGTRFVFGLDVAVVQSNFAQLEQFCSTLARGFPELSFIQFGAAIPAGLASRSRYAEQQLLTQQQLLTLGDPALLTRLRSCLPDNVSISIGDSSCFRMSPQQVQAGTAVKNIMELSPEGNVRGMLMYEGTVGNILHDPPEVLWQRTQERVGDPFVTEALSAVTTMEEWADATRRIDRHFASKEDLHRIGKRPEYAAPRHTLGE